MRLKEEYANRDDRLDPIQKPGIYFASVPKNLQKKLAIYCIRKNIRHTDWLRITLENLV